MYRKCLQFVGSRGGKSADGNGNRLLEGRNLHSLPDSNSTTLLNCIPSAYTCSDLWMIWRKSGVPNGSFLILHTSEPSAQTSKGMFFRFFTHKPNTPAGIIHIQRVISTLYVVAVFTAMRQPLQKKCRTTNQFLGSRRLMDASSRSPPSHGI